LREALAGRCPGASNDANRRSTSSVPSSETARRESTLTLGAPLALLGLLLVPVLLWLEQIRRRPRTLVVASLALWREMPVRPPGARRRRRRLRFLLRVLAVVALSTAASAPAVSSTRPATRTLVALVDRSPSMGAGDRLERAMAVVDRAAERFDVVRVLFTPSAPVRRQRPFVPLPAPASRAEPLEPALESLLGLVGDRDSSRALFVGDRPPPGGEVPGLGVALVGRPLDNAGVTHLRVETTDEGEPVVFVAWRAFDGDAPTLVLRVDGSEVDRIPGGPGRRSAVRALPREVRLVEVRLDHTGDALAADDHARAERRPGAGETVGLLGDDPPETLVAALRAVLGDRLVEGAPGPGGGIAWRRLPPPGASGRWVVVRPPEGWKGVGVREGPEIDAVAASRVVPGEELRGAFPPDLSADVTLGPAIRLVVPPDRTVLLRGPGGEPLVVARPDGSDAVLAFDPADPRGTLHESGAHPVLWRLLLEGTDRTTFVAEGILDEAESDLRGAERPLPPDFGADLPRAETTGRTSLRWPLAGVGLLAVAGLLALGLLDRRGPREDAA
jgi:hypothetical protein